MKYYAHFGHKDFILCLGYKGDVDQGVLPQLRRVPLQRFRPVAGRQAVELLDSDIDDWNITFVDTGLTANIGQRLKAVERTSTARRCFWPTTPTA